MENNPRGQYNLHLSPDEKKLVGILAAHRSSQNFSPTHAAAIRFAVQYTVKDLGLSNKREEVSLASKKRLHEKRDGIPLWKWWRDKRPGLIALIQKEEKQKVIKEYYKSMTITNWDKRIAVLPTMPNRKYTWEDIVQLNAEKSELELAIQQRMQDEEIADSCEPVGYQGLMKQIRTHEKNLKEAKRNGKTVEEVAIENERREREREEHDKKEREEMTNPYYY